MKILKVSLNIILFLFLTALTQVGGIVYLFSILTYKYSDKWVQNNFIKKYLGFLHLFYFIFSQLLL